MAESTVTQTGSQELRASVNAFPDVVTAALKAVARATAARVQTRAKASLLAQLTTSTTKLASAITVEEDAANHQVLVVSRPPAGQPAHVTIWNEYGTVRMGARPYMHPAAAAEVARYRSEMQTAAETVARDTFGS